MVKKKFGKKRGEGLSTIKLITFLLCGIVLVVIVLALANARLPEWFNNLLPDFLRQSQAVEILECPYGETLIASLKESGGYMFIYFNNQNTNLYLDMNKGSVMVVDKSLGLDWAAKDDAIGFYFTKGDNPNYGLSFGSDILDGSSHYFKDNSRMPAKEVFKSLQNSYKVKGRSMICKKNDIITDENACFDTCENMGVCRSVDSIPEDEIAYSASYFTCQDGKVCSVKKNMDQSSSDIKALNFNYRTVKDDLGSTSELLTDNKSIDAILGSSVKQYIEFKLSSNKHFCYYVSTNSRMLLKSSSDKNIIIDNNVIFVNQTQIFVPQINDRFIELVAFPKDNKANRIVRRIVLNPTVSKTWPEGKIVLNDQNFYNELKDFQAPGNLYIFGIRPFYKNEDYQRGVYSDFLIQKFSDNQINIMVYIPWKDRFYDVKCDISGFLYSRAYPKLSDFKDKTFSEFLRKNCKYQQPE